MSKKHYSSSIDVARLAGVSQATVSRVFSANGRVLQATRRKVLDAAADLGYRPSFIPLIMRHNRSRLVAVVICGIDNPFYATVLEAFTTGLQETGHQVLLVHVESEHMLDGVLPKLASYRVDAVVSALPVQSEAAAEQLASLRLPTVSFNTSMHNRFVSSVCPDNAGGGRAIADLFVARGCRSFGYIAGPESSHASRERSGGYRQGLRAHGHDRMAMAQADYSYTGGYEAALRLASVGELPQALFCANDLMAMGALDAVRHALGRRVPDDVMVAGFDDIPQAAWLSYDLTTIVQDSPRMVAQAIAILQSKLAAPELTRGTQQVVPGRLIERGSTAGQAGSYRSPRSPKPEAQQSGPAPLVQGEG